MTDGYQVTVIILVIIRMETQRLIERRVDIIIEAIVVRSVHSFLSNSCNFCKTYALMNSSAPLKMKLLFPISFFLSPASL